MSCFTCSKCGTACSTKHVLLRHWQRCHPQCPLPALDKVTCPHCSTSLPNKNSLKHHSRICQAQPGTSAVIYQCGICSVQYGSKKSRDRHVRIKHPETTRPEFHQCRNCPLRYREAGRLELHIRTKHHGSPTSDRPRPQFHQCPSCSLRYQHAAYLDRHVRAKHRATTTINGRVRYRCRLCEWPGSSLMSVRRHTRQVHTIHRTGRARCMHAGCPFASKTVTELRQHMVSFHGEMCDVTTMHFVNLTAFFQWRREHEHSRDVRFNVQSRRAGAFNMYCHRSGGTAMRGGRDGRSVRTGRLCTASMRVQLTDEDPALPVRVQACLHHHGHDSQRKHLRLSAVDRSAIADKIRAGVTLTRIMRDIRVSLASSSGEQRGHMIRMHDLRHIRRQELGGGVRDSNDVVSVSAMVASIRDHTGDNANGEVLVPLYKRQGDDVDGWAASDFAVVLTSVLQLKLLNSHGRRFVCMDGTHGTTGYDFSLITLLVAVNGRGFPVAWMLSNREDGVTISRFTSSLMEACEVQGIYFPSPLYFMSDCANALYNGFSVATGEQPRKLLCSWHVKRAWNNKVLALVEKSKQGSVRQQLDDLLVTSGRDPENYVILPEEGQCAVRQLVDDTVNQWMAHDGTRRFAEYFSREWLREDRLQEWAGCFREGSGVNVNMFVESFHRDFKRNYLGGMKNKRVDGCLEALLQYAAHRKHQLRVDECRPISSYRQREIDGNHARAAQVSQPAIEPVVRNGQQLADLWLIRSQSSSDPHVVQRYHHGCPNSPVCTLRCRPCDVCTCQFTCSCRNGLSGAKMCKHVHLVAGWLDPGASEGVDIELADPVSSSSDAGDDPSTSAHQHLRATPEQHSATQLAALARRLIETFPRVLSPQERELMEETARHLQATGAASTVLRALEENSARRQTTSASFPTNPATSRQPTNTRQDIQRRFVSTRRRRTRTNAAHTDTSPQVSHDHSYSLFE